MIGPTDVPESLPADVLARRDRLPFRMLYTESPDTPASRQATPASRKASKHPWGVKYPRGVQAS